MAAVLLVACGTTAEPEPKAIEVPDFLGEPLNEVRDWAEAEGVTLDDQTFMTNETKRLEPYFVTVVGQCPWPGEMLEPGETFVVDANPTDIVPAKMIRAVKEDPGTFAPC